MIGTVNAGGDRNAIGAHGGSYALYRALAVSSGALNPIARPDLTNTSPVVEIGPFPQWSEPGRIVSLDPWGHRVAEEFRAGDRRGRRYPPDHRDHQGAADDFRARRSRGERPPQGRRQDHARHRRCRRHQGGDRAGLVSARHRRALRRRGRRAAPHAVRADRRHVSGTGHAAGPLGVPAADRRHHALHFRRSGRGVGQAPHARLPRARRMQRLRRVRLRHLHLPAVSHPRHRGVHPRSAERRRRPDRLQSQGRPRARRGDQVPRLQCAQAPARRRPGGDLFRAHRMRRRRAGCALPATDAGRAALARHHAASTASSRCRT